MKNQKLASMLAVAGGLSVATAACTNDAADSGDETGYETAGCAAKGCCAAAGCEAKGCCAAADCEAKGCCAAAGCEAKGCCAAAE